MTDERPRFTPRPRRKAADTEPPDRRPAIDDALRGLAVECQTIAAAGRAAFEAPHSLTYRAAEAVVIHFHDVVSRRIEPERLARADLDLPLAAVTATRNILAHDYRNADTAIVWRVIETSIPDAIAALLAAD